MNTVSPAPSPCEARNGLVNVNWYTPLHGAAPPDCSAGEKRAGCATHSVPPPKGRLAGARLHISAPGCCGTACVVRTIISSPNATEGLPLEEIAGRQFCDVSFAVQ